MRRANASAAKGKQFYTLTGLFLLFTILVVIACALIAEQTISLIDNEYQRQMLTTVKLFAEYHSSRLSIGSSTEDEQEALLVQIPESNIIDKLDKAVYPEASAEADKLFGLLSAYISDYPLEDYCIYAFFPVSGAMVGGGKGGDTLPGTVKALLMGMVEDFLAGTDDKVQRLFYDAEDQPGTTTFVRLSANAALVYVQIGPPPITMIPDAFLENVQELELYYVDGAGTIVSMLEETQHMAMLSTQTVETLRQEGVCSVKADGKYYCCSYAEFNDMHMGFIIVTLDAPAMARQAMIRSVLILMTIMIVLCVFISLFGIRRIYRPVQAVVEELPVGEGNERDEMGRIRSAISSMNTRISRQQSLIARARLLHLLHASTMALEPDREVMFFFEKEQTPYVVAAFRIEDILPEYAHFDSALHNLEAWLEEHCREKDLQAVSVQEEEYLYMVFDLRDMEYEGFLACMERAKEGLEAEGLFVSAFLSPVHSGVEQLPIACAETLQTAAYCGAIESFNVIMCYADVLPLLYESTTSGISFTGLQKLSEAIETLDTEAALFIFDEYAEKLTALSSRSMVSARLGMSLLRDGVALALCEIGAARRLFYEDGPIAAAPVNLQKLRETLEDSLAALQNTPEKALENDDFALIERFVRENFRDPSFSALLVAERFGMSQSGVTRVFQKKTGVGFLAYVHGLRVELAKELLNTTALPISEVAEQVGYSNTLTMTRAFKRYAGATPGRYRKQ